MKEHHQNEDIYKESEWPHSVVILFTSVMNRGQGDLLQFYREVQNWIIDHGLTIGRDIRTQTVRREGSRVLLGIRVPGAPQNGQHVYGFRYEFIDPQMASLFKLRWG